MTRPLTGVTEVIPDRATPTIRELQYAFNAVNKAWGLRPTDMGRIRLHRVIFTGGWRVTQLDEHGADNYITPVLTRTEAMAALEAMLPGAQPTQIEPPADDTKNYCDADYEQSPWDVTPG